MLAGTFPLGLNTDSSDLDVVCYTKSPFRFANRLSTSFGWLPGFQARLRNIAGLPTVVAKFQYYGFPVEVFAQPKLPCKQRAVRHMKIEEQLLRLGGNELRSCVRALRRIGAKTEPAFARCLGLPGDPYLAVLSLENLTEAEVVELLRNGAYRREWRF